MNSISFTTYFNPWSKDHHSLDNFNYFSTEEKVAIIALTILVSVVSVGLLSVAVFRLLTDSTEPTQKFAKRIANYVIKELNLAKTFPKDVTFSLQKATLSLTKEEWESLDRHSFYLAIESVLANFQWDTFAVPGVGEISRTDLEKLLQSGFLAELPLLLRSGWQKDIDILLDSSYSPLQKAVFVGRTDLTKAFANSYPIDQLCSQGFTPLQYAILYGQKELILLLLDLGANVNHPTTVCPPLQMTKDPEIAKLLLDRGANLEQVCQSGVTPLVRAILEKNYKLACFFRQQGARLEDAKGAISPLTFCLVMKNMDLAKFVLSLKPSLDSLNAKNLLIKAVHQQNLSFVKLLLDYGVKANVQDSKGSTPLHYAIWQRNHEMTALLLDRGADINLPNAKGSTPLHSAVKQDNIEGVQRLLQRGVAANAADYLGRTPLMRAAYSGNKNIVKILLKRGASLHAKDLQGNTAILYALLNGQAKICDLFLKKDPHLLSEVNFNCLPPILHTKLKANGSYKKIKLFLPSFPLAHSLSREILYRKFLGHFFSLNGSSTLHANPSGIQPSLSIEMDGIIPTSYGNKQLKKSLEAFCRDFPQALPTDFKVVPPMYLDSASDLYAEWKKGECIQLSAGFSEHTTGCYVKGNRFILVNRGKGGEGKIVRIWSFNPARFNKKTIEQIQNLKDKSLEDYTHYMHTVLPQVLRCKQSLLEVSLEDHFNDSLFTQAAGNCSVINPQTAWQVLFQWDYILFKGCKRPSELKILLKESENLSQAILVFQKCLYINKYLKKKSSHFLSSPLLLAKIHYMLKRAQELSLPHIDKILENTIAGLDKRVTSLSKVSFDHLRPEAQKEWEKELKEASAFKKATEEYFDGQTSCLPFRWIPFIFWDLEPALEAEGWVNRT